MNRKSTYLKWVAAVTMMIFIWSGLAVQAQNRSLEGSSITAVSDGYLPGTTNAILNFYVWNNSTDAEWIIEAIMDFPAGMNVVSATDMGNLEYDGTTGDGALVTWDGNYITTQSGYNFSVTLDISLSLTGDVTIPWTLNGDSWGGLPHTVSGNIILPEIVDPGPQMAHLSMGYRPIGAWMEPARFSITNNPGMGDIMITDADISNFYSDFLEVVTPALPFVLESGETTTEFGITCTDEVVTPGIFNGDFAIIYGSGRALLTATYDGTAYEPIAADVVETAIDMGSYSAPASGTVQQYPEGRELFGHYKNYILPNDVGFGPQENDYVYKFTLLNDKLITFTSPNNPNFAIYAEDFNGEPGPMAHNALYQAYGTLDAALFAGTYYLVVSDVIDWQTWNWNITNMPAPDAVTYLSPADGAINITNGMFLNWEFGNNTFEYQLLLGTTYPPTNVMVPWTTNLAETYQLAGLQPNMQYFWQVNVRNSNGTTNGPVWGFTTTIDVPQGLTATVVDNDPSIPVVSVNLDWTGYSDRAFIGYNVFRDGIKINATPVTTSAYSDPGLSRNTTYAYTVTSLFDEGESAHSAPVTVTTKGVGTFNGYVYDFLTNDPIEGAHIALNGPAGAYNVVTNSLGYYTTLAYAGAYDITAGAEGYTPQTLVGEVVAHGGINSNDFYLMEVPYPVAEVIAFELNDNQVQISWDGTGPAPEPVTFRYDDGTATAQLGFGSGTINSVLGAVHRVDATLQEMSWFLTNEGGPHANIQIYVMGLTPGGLPDGNNVIYTASVTNTDMLWNTHVFPQPLVIEGGFYLAVGYNGFAGLGTDDGVGAPYVYQPNTHYYAGDYTTNAFTTFEPGFTLNALIRAYGVENAVASYAVNDAPMTVENKMAGLELRHCLPIHTGGPVWRTMQEGSADRGIISYDVWRQKYFQPGTLELIGTTFQQNFVDFEWGDQDWGVYQWAVTVNYDAGQTSVPTFSNKLDKDMYTTVDVEVVLNSNDSPTGTIVTFTNVSEPELELVYEETLGGSGVYTWDAFRRGTYDIQVYKLGYTGVNLEDVNIFDEASFEWMLNEILAPPLNLYVTPTGLATWESGVDMPGFDPYFSDLEANEGGWVAGGTTSATVWTWGTPAKSIINHAFSGTKAWVTGLTGDYSVNSNIWIAREFDFSEAMYPVISAQIFIETENNFDCMVLESSIDGGTTWQYVYSPGMYNSAAVSWGAFPGLEKWAGHGTDYVLFSGSLEDFAGLPSVWLRFRFVSDGSLSYNGIAIDDISVNDLPGRSGRQLEGYKVFLDGLLVADVSETHYQYGTNGEELVDGTTYLAEVATVYSTGQSVRVPYTWTYIACENYPVPGNFIADQVEGTIDVALTWTVPTIPPDEDQIDFARIYRDGEIIAEVETANYMDMDVEFGSHTYCITFVYLTGAETCPGTICQTVDVTGGGLVNGNVRQADYLGGSNIAGAEIVLTNVDDETLSFTFTTNALGNYSGEVLAGTYDYLVTAEGYASATLEDVEILESATVTRNFVLLEYPAPVGNVIATDQGTSALITWNTPGTNPAGAGFDLQFDDGMPDMLVLDTPANDWTVANDFLNNITGATGAWRAAYYNEEFTDFVYEAKLHRTVGNQTGSMGIYVRANGFMNPTAGNGTTGSVFCITQNGSYWYGTLTNGELVNWTGWLTSSAINTTGPNVLTAVAQGTTVQFLINGTLIYTVNNLPYESGFAGVFTHTGTSGNQTTVIDYMTLTPGAVVRSMSTNHVSHKTKGTLEQVYIPYENTVEPKGVDYFVPVTGGSRELTGYNVYRTSCYNSEELTFLGYTLDSTFVDNQWPSQEAGVYKWGVEAVYTANEAEVVFSNCLDKDMITEVSVTVITNSGESPEETDVLFVNVSEPDLELEYEVELDATGYYMWEEFRKGTYDILVEKNGFEPIILDDYVIDGPEAFEWVLMELLLPVEDLYVTPTGFATWRKGGVIPFEPVSFDFETDAQGWEIQNVVTGWRWGNSASLSSTFMSYAGNNTNFIAVNADAAGSGGNPIAVMAKSPMLNLENADEAYLSFNYILEWDALSVHYSIDGGDPVLLESLGEQSWGTHELMLPEEALQNNVQIIFFYEESGTWGYGCGVDDVIVTDEAPENLRVLEYYKVWLDGIFIADTENTWYQYDVETLVPGQEYYSEVAAMYTNGMSEKMDYTWTYIPCEDYPGPEVFEAEVIDNQDVLLSWSNVEPMQLIQLTQNPGAPANAYYEQFDYGYGVAFDLSAYPDALINSLDFHHAPWGLFGTWNYNIHVYNWDTKTLLGTIGPLQTTGDDIWEMGIDLGNIPTNGAQTVALLLEPLSGVSGDAYPNLSSDNATDPQGSIYGPLSDVNSIGSSTIGNFLMEAYILTAYGQVRATPVTFELTKAPAAVSKNGNTNFITGSTTLRQTASRAIDPFVGANIYRDGILIAEMLTDTTYLDESVEPAIYNYCITYVYESGAMSCMDANCLEVSVMEDCVPPMDLTGDINDDETEIYLEWNTFAGLWMSYGDLVYADAIGLTDFSPVTVAIQWDPEDLAEYDGRAFTKFRFYYGTGSIGDVVVQIWEGTTLVLEEPVTTNIVGESWNEVDYVDPVVIDATKSYRLGYTVSNYDAYPAGAQNYVGDPNSDLVFLGGAWDNLSNYLPYSWLIETFIGNAPAGAVNTPVVSSIENTAVAANLADAPKVSLGRSNVGRNPDRALLGYNVYRNDVQVNDELVLETNYTDTGFGTGDICYVVTAVYSMCGESEPSNEVCFEGISAANYDLSQLRVYPNPSNSLVNIELNNNVNRIEIYNYAGQIVYQQTITKELMIQVDVRNYEAGAYLVRFINNDGKTLTKKIAVTK